MAVIEHPPDPHPVEHAVKHPGRPGATESAATDKSHRLDLAHLSVPGRMQFEREQNDGVGRDRHVDQLRSLLE
jgi:hypothetical protein